MLDVICKGRFSYGLDQTSYGHLPAWKDLAQRKKQMVKRIWLLAFFVWLMVVSMAGDFGERLSQNWWKAIVLLIVVSVMAGLFYVMDSFYTLFVEFRNTEREVRKLIYQDILFQLKKKKRKLCEKRNKRKIAP